MAKLLKVPIKAVCIDLSGTLHVGEQATPNAVEALKKLRTLPVHVRFVTNTTKESRKTLHHRLAQVIGFDIDSSEIFSSLSAAVNYVIKENLNPYYLVSDDARTDFPLNSPDKDLDSVVVGLAPEHFHYESMTKAFNILKQKKPLIAIHEGRYYKREDGLALGPGCFVRGLEYSSGVNSFVVGKPNKYFFKAAIPEGCKPEDCVMIGDDIHDDVEGAMKIGMQAILVKTGKYLPNSEKEIDTPPTLLCENFSEAVNCIADSIKNC